MLFDLRGRGRRRTVQAIYLSLALLMGGGLVLFGIGSNTSGGGILDAVVGDGSSGSSATETIDKRIKAAVAKTRATPREPAVWAELARLRYQRAGIDGIGADDVTYTDKGKAKLRLATQAWERHLALDPKQPNVRVARLMVQAYAATALNDPTKAVQAMQVVTAAEKPPSSNLFAQLAQLSYQARDIRTGDLAADRAVELADKSDKKLLRTELDRIKTEAAKPPAATSTDSG
ncbi:MAG TPA: hypothetical protein VGO80_15880 [Solirubrobacteraceae bacterium]|jgi:hypothetical protein|nr:hypothetical protein [Solirubrobacteraceae bacterium]